MPHAIQMHQTGGPEVLNWTAVDVGEPGSGQVRLRQAAAGLNYIDVYHRTGYYPQPLPFIPGPEGAGTVEAVAPDVRGLKVGDRVAYAGPAGGYSEVRRIEADRLVRLPEAISFDQAAAMMLQGMTAQVLIRQVYPVKAGDLILVHAAAGRTGLILCQWAAALGHCARAAVAEGFAVSDAPVSLPLHRATRCARSLRERAVRGGDFGKGAHQRQSALCAQGCCGRPQGIGSARNLGLHDPDHLTQYSQEFFMNKTPITSPELAPPVGPFSQAIEVGGFLYFSGQVGQDPATGKVVEGGIVAETERVFRNLAAVLKAAGKSFDHVARAGVYLTNMSDFVAMNGIYAKHFSQPFPARTTIAVAALPLGACVEIDLVVKA